MIFDLKIEKGVVVKGSKELGVYLKKLNGNYTIDINEENTLTTVKECRGAYFFKVDLVGRYSGDERYDIHEAFKIDSKIESTKNYTVTDWRNLLKRFQIYVFKNYDIVI